VAAISGPASGEVGEALSFLNTSGGDMVTWAWDVDGVAQGEGMPLLTVVWDEPGCHTVGLTVFYPAPADPGYAAMAVSIGGAACQ
jgi:PKD repeat protein